MSSRLAVTVRFNADERHNLRMLAEFFNLDERRVLKLAFQQLALATEQLQKKLKEKSNEDTTVGTVRDSDVGSDVDAASAGADGTGVTPVVSNPEPATD